MQLTLPTIPSPTPEEKALAQVVYLLRECPDFLSGYSGDGPLEDDGSFSLDQLGLWRDCDGYLLETHPMDGYDFLVYYAALDHYFISPNGDLLGAQLSVRQFGPTVLVNTLTQTLTCGDLPPRTYTDNADLTSAVSDLYTHLL